MYACPLASGVRSSWLDATHDELRWPSNEAEMQVVPRQRWVTQSRDWFKHLSRQRATLSYKHIASRPLRLDKGFHRASKMTALAEASQAVTVSLVVFGITAGVNQLADAFHKWHELGQRLWNLKISIEDHYNALHRRLGDRFARGDGKSRVAVESS